MPNWLASSRRHYQRGAPVVVAGQKGGEVVLVPGMACDAMMHQRVLRISTRGQGLFNITSEVSRVVADSRVQTGICVVFVRHTSASLVIQENADPSVQHDLSRWMAELAPESRNWEHDDEGLDDMPAHARAAITCTNEVIPIVEGRLGLGTWQGIYLWEHRRSAHERQVIVHVQGE